MAKKINLQEDIENNKDTKSELSPTKQNLMTIISVLLFGLLIWGTVFATDYITDLIGKLF